MLLKCKTAGLAAVAFVMLASACQAATISTSLSDFDGPSISAGFPYDLGVVGTFVFSLPSGATITSATFSGTYGTAAVDSSTAGFDAVIGGQTLNVCIPNDPGCWLVGAPFRPFSFALAPSTYATLLTGSVDLQIIQTNPQFVRLGTPTLTIDYSDVPEPSSVVLLGLGLAAGFAARRRLRQV